MTFTPDTYLARRKRVLAQAQEEASFDALCISDPVNIRYLTGLAEGSYHLLLSADGDLLLVTWMFHDRARAECPGLELGLIEPPLSESITGVIRQRGWSRIALVERETRLSEWRRWHARMGAEGVITVSDVVMQCRAIKDFTEIALLQEAVRVAEHAFLELTSRGRSYFIGRSERELALALEVLMRSNGAEDQSFPNGIILAAGANSYGAHYVPGDARVEDGQSILIDCGTLAAGMVMTVEPGIYVKGLGGIRLENDVLVTETGCKVLGTLDLDWTVLP